MAILRSTGYVQVRRGLHDHVLDGEIGQTEYFLYMMILNNADPATGIWKNSSAGLLSSLYREPVRKCQRAIERLEEKGYIKRFHRQGKHGGYPILINKFEVTDGSLKGKRLNSDKSTSLSQLIYEYVADDGSDVSLNRHRAVAEVSPKYLENREQENRELKTIAHGASADERKSVDLNAAKGWAEQCHDAYPRKVGKRASILKFTVAIANTSKSKKISVDAAGEWMLNRVREYAASPLVTTTEIKLIPHPSTWAGQGRYDDAAEEWQITAPKAIARGPFEPGMQNDDRAQRAEAQANELYASLCRRRDAGEALRSYEAEYIAKHEAVSFSTVH